MISTGGHLTILESVDSTNNYAMARVRTGLAKHGDGFFAMAQVQGKGQRGKTWVTEPGTNIIITLVMQPAGLQLTQQFRLSTAVALAVHDFFAGYAGDETSVKWPNDIYWRDRKAGGILIESIVGAGAAPTRSSEEANSNIGSINTVSLPEAIMDNAPNPAAWQWAIIGIGININQTAFPEHIRQAVSLQQITGKEWDVLALTEELCACVQRRFEQLQAGKPLLQEYNSRLYKKDQTVKLKQGSRVFSGAIKEVNSRGELVVMTGLEERFSFGEVEWVME